MIISHRTFYLFLLLSWVLSPRILAQADFTPPEKVQDQFILKTNPFNLIAGPIFPFVSEARITGEVVHGLKQSSQLSASYLFKGVLLSMVDNSTPGGLGIDELIFEGFRIQAAHRIFLMSSTKSKMKAPVGLYIGPHASYSSLKIADRYFNQFQSYFRATYFNVNLLVGYQLNLGRAYFDFNFGLGYKNNYWIEQLATQRRVVPPDELGYGPYFSSPLKVQCGFELGYAF